MYFEYISRCEKSKVTIQFFVESFSIPSVFGKFSRFLASDVECKQMRCDSLSIMMKPTSPVNAIIVPFMDFYRPNFMVGTTAIDTVIVCHKMNERIERSRYNYLHEIKCIVHWCAKLASTYRVFFFHKRI